MEVLKERRKLELCFDKEFNLSALCFELLIFSTVFWPWFGWGKRYAIALPKLPPQISQSAFTLRPTLDFLSRKGPSGVA